jgi:hypothetical protein
MREAQEERLAAAAPTAGPVLPAAWRAGAPPPHDAPPLQWGGGGGKASEHVAGLLAATPCVVPAAPPRLAPGALLPGPARGRAFRLGARLHQGPRSCVWAAAAVPSGRRVVLKVRACARGRG